MKTEIKGTEVWGPGAGSTRIVVDRMWYDRVEVRVTTDFGTARGVLNNEGARKLRDALNKILEE